MMSPHEICSANPLDYVEPTNRPPNLTSGPLVLAMSTAQPPVQKNKSREFYDLIRRIGAPSIARDVAQTSVVCARVKLVEPSRSV